MYDSTPRATISTPCRKLSGESMDTSAPAAVKLTIRLITLPSTFDSARIIWLQRPWRACMISASVCAWGATCLKRRPKG
ncbi:hypothetical protein D3C78_1336220 [compost metagenome]